MLTSLSGKYCAPSFIITLLEYEGSVRSLRCSVLLKKQGAASGCLCANPGFLGNAGIIAFTCELSQEKLLIFHPLQPHHRWGITSCWLFCRVQRETQGNVGNVGSSTCCASEENGPRNGAQPQRGGCEQPRGENGAIIQLTMANPLSHEFLITLALLSQEVINIFLTKEHSSKAGTQILPRGPWVNVQSSTNSRSRQLQMISWAQCERPQCTSSDYIQQIGRPSQATRARGVFRARVAFRCVSVQEPLQGICILPGSNRRVHL